MNYVTKLLQLIYPRLEINRTDSSSPPLVGVAVLWHDGSTFASQGISWGAWRGDWRALGNPARGLNGRLRELLLHADNKEQSIMFQNK